MALKRNVRIIVLMFYALHPSPQQPIIVFLRRKQFHCTNEILVRLAEDALASATEAEMKDLFRDGTWEWQRNVAQRLLAEYDLYQWCLSANARGFGPSTAQLVREARKHNALPASLRRGGNMSVAARVWAMGWRRRWNIKLGIAKSADTMPADEFQSKVRIFRLIS